MSHLQPGSITVLVVEDSAAVAEFLRAVLSADPAIRVVGVARDGAAAIEAAHKLRPAIITMDVHMPGMDGFEATRLIMETCPTPVVIVSGIEPAAAEGHPLALASGALAMVPMPNDVGHPAHEESTRRLLETVKLMSEVKVVRRWPQASAARRTVAAPIEHDRHTSGIRLVAIGASTGGPLALQSILNGLPRQMPVPMLIVQHMAVGFVSGFCEWLQHSTGYPVRLAIDGEQALAGHAYVAPDAMHMGLGAEGRILLSSAAPENGVRPAVSFMFRSLQSMAPDVLAVLLSGMGRDGVDALKLLKDAGARTLVQDEASCVVFGMPGQAVKAGAASHVLSPGGIAATLATLAARP
jgi:two-component system chemotaxis response regulator CheB